MQQNLEVKMNIYRPALSSIVVTLGSFLLGANMGYPSTAIPDLNSRNGPFKMNPEELSWFISIPFLCSFPATFLSGFAMDKYGRKTTILFTTLPNVIGWVVIACACNVETMYFGRILTGIAGGLLLPAVGVYISEIAPSSIRGSLMSIHETALNVGVLFMYVLGTFISWNWLAIVCAAFVTIMACALLLVPETPRWLVMNNERDRAIETLEWIRGVDSGHELKQIEESIKDTKEMTPWLHFLKPPLLKKVLITVFLFILQELSGINVLRENTVIIFEMAKTSLNPNIETIIVGLMLVAGSVLFTLIVERKERRVFLLISSMMMVVGLAAVAAYIKIDEVHPNFAQSKLCWLPLFAMVTICFGFVLGVGPLPYIITSEIFNSRARGRANSIGVGTLVFTCFFITKFFVNMCEALGDAGSFLFCSSVCLVGFIIALFTVPETKGKVLEAIQV